MPAAAGTRDVPDLGSKAVWILIALVFLPSLALRLNPVTSESFQYDAVVSQMAAREGVSANAWDSPHAFWLRRFHPPLLSYLIQLNNRVLGDDPFRARIFSIVFGSLTCLVVALAIAMLLPPFPGRIAWAVFGGLLLCLLPVHMYVSRTSNWDAVYGFFATSSLFCLAAYVMRGSTIWLYGTALFATLAFLTCELGLSLLPAILFVAVRDAMHARGARVALRWAGVLLFVVVLSALIWPAGVLKLDVARMLLYRWQDSAAAQRNFPWYVFYTTLFRQAPAFTLFVVFGIIATGLSFVRKSVPSRDGGWSPGFVASLPFWIYVTTAFLLSVKQRLVYVHHIVDMFPPLVIAVCLGLATRTGFPGGTRTRWVRGIAVVVLALSLVAAFNPDPEVVGPQEHPGFLGVSAFLKDYPGSRIYCYDTVVLGFYLPGASIEGDPSRVWTPEEVANVKRENYDFIVFDRAKLNHEFPTADALAGAFSPEYRVKESVTHRRTGAQVAWILAREP